MIWIYFRSIFEIQFGLTLNYKAKNVADSGRRSVSVQNHEIEASLRAARLKQTDNFYKIYKLI